jgi:LEA14-like dessication related protein
MQVKIRCLFLLILVALSVSSCTDVQGPVTVFNKYEINHIGLNKADLAFLFDIENPNNIPIGIKDVNYSISLDGNSFMTGTYEGFSLQAKEKKSVRIPIELIYSRMIGPAANVARKFIMRDSCIKYALDGQALIVDNVGFSSKVPLHADGEIKLF